LHWAKAHRAVCTPRSESTGPPVPPVAASEPKPLVLQSE
jgi:hypothetical protein